MVWCWDPPFPVFDFSFLVFFSFSPFFFFSLTLLTTTPPQKTELSLLPPSPLSLTPKVVALGLYPTAHQLATQAYFVFVQTKRYRSSSGGTLWHPKSTAARRCCFFLPVQSSPLCVPTGPKKKKKKPSLCPYLTEVASIGRPHAVERASPADLHQKWTCFCDR